MYSAQPSQCRFHLPLQVDILIHLLTIWTFSFVPIQGFCEFFYWAVCLFTLYSVWEYLDSCTHSKYFLLFSAVCLFTFVPVVNLLPLFALLFESKTGLWRMAFFASWLYDRLWWWKMLEVLAERLERKSYFLPSAVLKIREAAGAVKPHFSHLWVWAIASPALITAITEAAWDRQFLPSPAHSPSKCGNSILSVYFRSTAGDA